MLTTCLILCLQETHLNLHDSTALQTSFPDHLILYNNGTNNRAGTLALIDRRLLKHYTVTQRALPACTRGHAQVITLSPRHPRGEVHSSPLQIYNLYLPSQNHWRKRPVLQALLGLPRLPEGTHIMCGDFNFTERADDHLPPSRSNQLDNTTLPVWESLLEHLQLAELTQPAHTYYHGTRNWHTMRSARLDRIYASYTLAQSAIINPSSHIPYTKHNKLRTLRALDCSPASPDDPRVTKLPPGPDHLPVRLTFSLAPPPPRRNRANQSVPSWLAAHPDARAHILEAWGGAREGECPYAALSRWKRAAHDFTAFHFARVTREKLAFH